MLFLSNQFTTVAIVNSVDYKFQICAMKFASTLGRQCLQMKLKETLMTVAILVLERSKERIPTWGAPKPPAKGKNRTPSPTGTQE